MVFVVDFQCSVIGNATDEAQSQYILAPGTDSVDADQVIYFCAHAVIRIEVILQIFLIFSITFYRRLHQESWGWIWTSHILQMSEM